ncbi:hypothetical protein LU290_07060 [Moraxella nasibovis]|uniref:hypothetical protein n=1 Tax=Moraxella nasibovis TaxID=2904120 RepID=UPI00241006E3|nr:hypothetical protein [Moraxella nasibovis]WFF38017.1 hypothetical protein LU290_07060 [Moraxella nasibovis]
MPKVTTNPKSRTQIQADSDAKRGIKIKAFKLHLDDIAMIEQVAERLGLPQNQLIVEAVRAYEKGFD